MLAYGRIRPNPYSAPLCFIDELSQYYTLAVNDFVTCVLKPVAVKDRYFLSDDIMALCRPYSNELYCVTIYSDTLVQGRLRIADYYLDEFVQNFLESRMHTLSRVHQLCLQLFRDHYRLLNKEQHNNY